MSRIVCRTIAFLLPTLSIVAAGPTTAQPPFKAKAKAPAAKAAADDRPITADQAAFFEKRIRPVLVDKCYSCHTAETAKGPKGGLILDTRAGLRTGGESGPALIPGNPTRSLLVKALHGDNVSRMPPKEKLPADVIADFETWIKMGAPDPRIGSAPAAYAAIDIAKGKEFWSFQPIAKATPPKADDNTWTKTDLDRFILAKLGDKKLVPVADADKRTLLRRVTFDLIGLPPSAAELETFVNDAAPDAFEKVVDRLLASKHFGEKWGRHWLDVARYAESCGKDVNLLQPHAWRYRDYVIAAFNDDKPIDQFFREQLAGDLLPAKDDNARAQHLIATGFLAIGPKSQGERDRRQYLLDVADEQIDAFSQGMLGLTVSCARCHDHKFDPIPTRDYYALAGIFTSTETKAGLPTLIIARHGSDAVKLPAAANVPDGQRLSKTEVEALKKRLEQLEKQRAEIMGVNAVGILIQIGAVKNQIEQYDADGAPRKLAMGAADKTFAKDMPIHIRGDVQKTGDIVPRGFLQVLAPTSRPIRRGSGRLELADWVTSANNPLPARVFVNRVWHHLFGKGIVPTPDNFGASGLPPTHPELLDFLASRFTADGWSSKKLIREIVLSRTYQLGSEHHAANYAIDPDNAYLWRMSKRRLSAEEIRDAMLAVSGDLDPAPANGSPVGRRNAFARGPGGGGPFGGGPNMMDTNKRSVYVPIIRGSVPEVFELFDFPDPSLVAGARDDTSVASQALYLMNNSQVQKWSDAFAAKLLRDASSETERIDLAFRRALGRNPSEKEAATIERYLKSFRAGDAGSFRARGNLDERAWSAVAQSLFATAEFRYLD